MNFAQFWPQTLQALLEGTLTAGTATPVAIVGETGVVGASPYHYALANASTLVAGSLVVAVIDANGNPVYYSQVAASSEVSSSTAGQAGGGYSLSAGVLTFAAADAGLTVLVNYLYTPASGHDSSKLALSQVGMNSATVFKLRLVGTAAHNGFTNQSQQFIVELNNCLLPSLKMDFKLDDWTYMDLDYQAFIDASGNLGNLYLINPGGVAATA